MFYIHETHVDPSSELNSYDIRHPGSSPPHKDDPIVTHESSMQTPAHLKTITTHEDDAMVKAESAMQAALARGSAMQAPSAHLRSPPHKDDEMVIMAESSLQAALARASSMQAPLAHLRSSHHTMGMMPEHIQPFSLLI